VAARIRSTLSSSLTRPSQTMRPSSRSS
jgi:hypothetical protein